MLFHYILALGTSLNLVFSVVLVLVQAINCVAYVVQAKFLLVRSIMSISIYVYKLLNIVDKLWTSFNTSSIRNSNLVLV